MKLPYYVDRGGEQVYRPPFTAAKVDFYGFLLKADKDRMQHIICDGWLNGPMGTPGRFKMFSRFAILVFNKMDALTNINPPYNYRGVFPEKECAVWVMIEDTVEGGIYFTQPYIFVDNAYALSMGREIYGFPKALGEFDLPEDHTDPAHFAMKTMVVPKFGPNAPVSIEPFVTVERTSETKEAQELNDLRHLAALLHEAIDDGEELSRLGRNPWVDLWKHDIPMIFLKQIRAAGNPTRADYQAITSLVCQATNWQWPKIYKADYTVDFGDFDSHPIRSDLGLAEGPITSTLNFYTKIDFWIGPGETLWSSTDTGARG